MNSPVEALIHGKNLGQSARTLRGIAHPLRLQLISFIDTHKKVNVNKIYRSLHLEQSITSQHLRVLRDEKLVLTSREGKFIFYSVNYPRIKKIVELIDGFFAS